VRPAAFALVLAVTLAGAACSRAPQRDPWAASAVTAHRRADALLDTGDVAGARAALRALVDEAGPRGEVIAPRRLAVQDTYFRLARLSLAAHDARQALADADAGLAYGTEPHLFVANLLVARGAALEATGDARGAAEDYHRALLMNEALLDRTLGK
jgi:tetratricopeptide (TPR) repeat protein